MDPPREVDVEVVHVPRLPGHRRPGLAGGRGRGATAGANTPGSLESRRRPLRRGDQGDRGRGRRRGRRPLRRGKDRTGLVAALMLRLVGVPHEAIVEDYVTSGRNLGSAASAPWIEQAPDDEERGAASTSP